MFDLGSATPYQFCALEQTSSGESEFLVGANNRALILFYGLVCSTSLIAYVEAQVNGVPFAVSGIASSSDPLPTFSAGLCWVTAEPGDVISIVASVTDGDTWSGILSGVLFGAYTN